MSLKLYCDLISPPSRAVYMFLKAVNVPFEYKKVDISKDEHRSNEYKQISKLHEIPILDDDGFKIMESGAIVRYVARQNKIADHWYPSNSVKQAKVDEYLEWQHHNTRFMCYIYYDLKYLKPRLSGIPYDPVKVEPFKDRMINCMDKLETIWLKNNLFLAGDQISFADVSCISDLDQTIIAGYDPRKDRPLLSAWMDRVKQCMSPHYEEVTSKINK